MDDDIPTMPDSIKITYKPDSLKRNTPNLHWDPVHRRWVKTIIHPNANVTMTVQIESDDESEREIAGNPPLE